MLSSSTRPIADKTASRQTASVWVETYLGPAILRLGGAALVLAAAGLWLAPGVAADAELALMKLGASLFLAALGVVLLLAGRRSGVDEVQIDTIQREIRIVTRGIDGIARLRGRYRFCDICDLRVEDDVLLARDHTGRVVLNRPIGNLDVADVIDIARQNGLIRKM